MKNINIPIFVIDFEGSKELGVVEYGIVELYAGEIISCKTGFCTPRKLPSSREAMALEISEIKLSDLDSMERFENLIPEFKAMRNRGLFAAHNAAFEDAMMRSYIPSPCEVPDFVSSNKTVYTWGIWLDSFQFVRNIYPSLKSAKLSDAIMALGFLEKLESLAEKHCPDTRRKWHCALFDALASALLFTEICSQDGFEGVTLPWIAKYSGNPESTQDSLF